MGCIQLLLISSVLLGVVIAAPQQQQQQQPSNFYDSNRNQNENSPQQQYSQTPVPIISQKHEQNPDGSYYYSYEAGNGITAEERGAIKNLGQQDNEINTVQGFFSYPGTDGRQYLVSYTADERGFLASGAHLPTSPPLPDAIVKALENLPKDNTEYDDNGFPLPPRNNGGYQNSQPTGFPNSQSTGFSNSQPGGFSNSQPTGFPNSQQQQGGFLNSQSRPTGPSSQSRPTGPSSGPSSFGEPFQGFGGRA